MSDLLKPTSEFERQISLLMADVGVPGSGAVRYAAAMYFHKEKSMPHNMLEIYRICSKFDQEDPLVVAKFEGVEIPPIVARTDVSGEK
ncbi:MAG: hypothetical protein ACKVLN_06345 [Rhodobacterales bacterium]